MEATGAQQRNCVSCGRTIAWDANVCPYCGHDYRPQMMAPSQGQLGMSEGVKIIVYILSLLIWIVGVVVGIVYYTKPDNESKEFGKMCIILAVLGIILWTFFAIMGALL